MKISSALLAASLLFAVGFPNSATAGRPEILPSVASVNAEKIFLTKEAGRLAQQPATDLLYHNGPVMTAPVTVRPIYWGTKWANLNYIGDKTTGLTNLYSGYSNSAHAAISSQYGQSNGAKTSTVVSVVAPVIDTTAAKYSRTLDISKEVLKMNPTSLDETAYYPVYTDIPRGSAKFCAWHSSFTTTDGKHIKFAFFFDIQNDTSCSVTGAYTEPSLVTQSLANVSIHELAEAMTDPEITAWYDKNGLENADKCAWKFKEVTLNQTKWILQGEWDNKIHGCAW